MAILPSEAGGTRPPGAAPPVRVATLVTATRTTDGLPHGGVQTPVTGLGCSLMAPVVGTVVGDAVAGPAFLALVAVGVPEAVALILAGGVRRRVATAPPSVPDAVPPPVRTAGVGDGWMIAPSSIATVEAPLA